MHREIPENVSAREFCVTEPERDIAFFSNNKHSLSFFSGGEWVFPSFSDRLALLTKWHLKLYRRFTTKFLEPPAGFEPATY